ncbi:DUF2905 domain-containing protein [Alkalicoccobacillus gibsonii]|jgi:hypothetical protein|uniref:DUF2905 domain-containing protein n=1 Tax=Alkalicoccobacillus gibsonii TaxID=79881 RepID=A0ABU9VGF2_9BACI|nr:DUF2905 domain-containing protein [Alkalicoccobacillus gibsonii]MBM0064186.1 DUF2905 domain-containing protein [Alkalicoccobacillus gibsonii]
MNEAPKFLIIAGIILVIVGLLWYVGGKFLPIGKLPGDIVIKRENMTFYFPLMTSIVVSVVLSLLLFLFRR